MNCLLVDVGNTRVKWATSDGRRLATSRSAAYAEWSAEDWRETLLGECRFERVLVASVARGEAVDRLRMAVRVATGREAEFVASTREAAGVRNAYRDPVQLGVDRWLAVVAAHHDPGGACCVVDVGTAATVDAVRGDGQHLGGFIVPGPDLMVGSLLRGTSDLAVRSASSEPGAAAYFADNTRDAIHRGCRLALASLVDRSVADLGRLLGTLPHLLLTGGAAGEIQPHLRSSFTLDPDLVLRGLAVVSTCPGTPDGTAGLDPHSKQAGETGR